MVNKIQLIYSAQQFLASTYKDGEKKRKRTYMKYDELSMYLFTTDSNECESMRENRETLKWNWLILGEID